MSLLPPTRPPQELVAVRFTPVPEGEPGKHMDPITKETFTNTSRLVVLAPTGWVQLRVQPGARPRLQIGLLVCISRTSLCCHSA